MATQITLQRDQLEDFLVIRNLDPAKLQAAVDALRRAKPPPMRPDRLAAVIADGLAEHRDGADSIVRQVLTVYPWIMHAGLKVAELQADIREAVKTDFQWTDEEIKKWQQVEPALAELLSLPVLRLVASAIDLSYEYTNLWQGARILTDIRPIFNEEATAIDGAVVSHAFRLQFKSIDGPHELNIAMTESDIRALTDQCDRALQKAQTAGSLMRNNAKVPTLISGESENA